jgi:hypothetical protein
MYPLNSPDDLMIFKVEQRNERPIDTDIRKKITTFLESKRQRPRQIMTEE